MDIACDNKLVGRLNKGVLEVRCRSALCGKRSGVVVMHYFDLRDNGKMTTKLFKDTPPTRLEKQHGMG
jgi:hypothetical protein